MSEHNEIQDLDEQLLKQMLEDFLEEALELLDQLNLNLIQLEDEPDNQDLIDQIFRIAHTIKGSAGFAGLEEMSSIGRKMEDILGEIRKGSMKADPAFIEVMFEGLDVLSSLREKSSSGDHAAVDIEPVLANLDRLSSSSAPASATAPAKQSAREIESSATDELLQIYKKGYDQLGALKHLIYSSTYLSDEDTLAILISKQIHKLLPSGRNAFWLVKNDKKVVEIALDGKLAAESGRRSLDISSSSIIERVIKEQLVVWASSNPKVKELLPEFESPILIPVKAKPQAYGFLVLDPEESAEVESYQFVAEFAAMILKISKLHRKVDDQRKELDEMTAILFRQNNILSSLYHVELDLMRITDPLGLCRIVTEAFVHDLETRTAAIFLKDDSGTRLKGIRGSGGLEGIDSIDISIDSSEPIQRCLETGRIVSQKDSGEQLQLGSNTLDSWIVMGLKGRETTHGVVIAELDEDDITDSMSILANYSGILLDNLILEKKAGK